MGHSQSKFCESVFPLIPHLTTGCVEAFPPDLLLPAAAKALQSVQQPRCKCAILAWFCDGLARPCSTAAQASSPGFMYGLRCGMAHETPVPRLVLCGLTDNSVHISVGDSCHGS